MLSASPSLSAMDANPYEAPELLKRRRIGVWSEMPPGSKWANEGVTRVLGFLIEGAAARGDICFEVVAPHGMQATIEADLRTLAAREGLDWIVHATPKPQLNTEAQPSRPDPANEISGLADFIVRLPSPALAVLTTILAVTAFPMAAIRGIIRGRVSAQDWRQRVSVLKSAALRPREALRLAAGFLKTLGFKPAIRLGDDLVIAITPPTLGPSHEEARDFNEHLKQMAGFANAYVEVEGWIVLFPFYLGSALLKKPRAVIFPDALVYDFPIGWDPNVYWRAGGHWPSWREKCAQLLKASDTVITFSEHVARRHVVEMFGLNQNRIQCIPLAPPDLMAYLPFLQQTDRHSTAGTRRHAADLLRAFALQAGNRYLADFPFETAPYFVVATQDRPTKNIGLAARALATLVRQLGINVKMITTARFFWGETWTSLPGIVEDEQLQYDVLSMPDLPREVHAALFHCAALTVHPSFFEGIVGTLPLFESLSVGTPCIFARGPHTEELIEREPDLAGFMFDPYDAVGLTEMIRAILEDRDVAVGVQMPIGERLRGYSWSDAADLYARAAIGKSQGDLRFVDQRDFPITGSVHG
jgi:glycosyltransferase involved in cell wall biosynthesis